MEFSTDSGYHNINFRDKTSLNLEIEASFTLEADYSDWKTGNQRIIRAWGPHLHGCRIANADPLAVR